MVLITDSERQYFARVIDEAGLSVGDFAVNEVPDEDPTAGVGPNTGAITVTYMPTNTRRAYHTGHIPTWSNLFERDLQLNMFETR